MARSVQSSSLCIMRMHMCWKHAPLGAFCEHEHVHTHVHAHLAVCVQVEEGLLDALHARLLPCVPTLSPTSTAAVCVALARLGSSCSGRLPAPVCDALFAHALTQVGARTEAMGFHW